MTYYFSFYPLIYYPSKFIHQTMIYIINLNSCENCELYQTKENNKILNLQKLIYLQNHSVLRFSFDYFLENLDINL